MTGPVDAAGAFVTTHGRLLDRRRLHLPLGECSRDDVWAALRAYRNDDGGYGWGLEPDLPAPESQPVGAMHALEVLAEGGMTGPREVPRVLDLVQWLERHSLPDGGLPFALPMAETTGSARSGPPPTPAPRRCR